MNENFQSNYAEMLPAIVKNLRKGNNLAQANKDPVKYFKKFGIPMADSMQYELFINSDSEYYFVIPEQSNDNLSSDQLSYAIGGAQTLQCVSSATTFSSVGTILSFSTVIGAPEVSASSFSSLGSIAATGSTASSKGSHET